MVNNNIGDGKVGVALQLREKRVSISPWLPPPLGFAIARKRLFLETA
jgi:hypothetical protein